MSVESISSRIIQTDKFISNYTALLIKSVGSQLPDLVHEDEQESVINWSYLLSCASIFSNSSQGQFLDIAYRICQTTICEQGLPAEYKSVAAAIFALLSNSSAITLSMKRGLVEESYLSDIPYGSLLDIKRQQISNSARRKILCKRNSTKSRMAQGKQGGIWL